MEQKEEQFGTPVPDTEPGMNLISVDFDIVMVNRTNERLYAKPMVAMLGNKCYQEFEKRDAPCPHCPGRLALQTGVAQEAETTGLRDDGTRFAARIKAHPVIGPDNRPTGFIEIVEDITELKRAERLAFIDGQLQGWLAGIQNTKGALREALRAVLLVEGVDCGAAFELGNGDDRPKLVQERGLVPAWVEIFFDMAQKASLPGASTQPYVEQPASPRPAGFPRVVVVIPILQRASPRAALVVGSTVYPVMPASLRTGLQVLGTTTGTAISRIEGTPSPTWKPSSTSLPSLPGRSMAGVTSPCGTEQRRRYSVGRPAKWWAEYPPGDRRRPPPGRGRRSWTERTAVRWR